MIRKSAGPSGSAAVGGWHLPTDGPKTLNGLILAHLEAFPDGPASLQIGNVRMEILEVRDNLITEARCWQAVLGRQSKS